MTRAQRYEADRRIEKGVAQFLDENFYSVFKEKLPVVRWTDTTHQWAGVDLTINNVNFDEKVKIRGCLNNVYGYPSFEISFKNKGNKIQDGWFLQQTQTHYYIYIGVYANTNDESLVADPKNITKCDLLWVKKSDVVDLVEQSMTMEQLKADAKALREDDFLYEPKRRKTYPHGKFWLTYSGCLQEKPVNLVLHRSTLEKLPHSKHFIVSREEGVKRV